MMKINPDDNSNCSKQINPDEEPQDQEPKQDQTFLTFEEIKARRQTAQSKYQQKKYFSAVFGDKN